MKLTTVTLTVLAATLVFSAQSMAAGKAHWSYTGHEGPEHWGGAG